MLISNIYQKKCHICDKNVNYKIVCHGHCYYDESYNYEQERILCKKCSIKCNNCNKTLCVNCAADHNKLQPFKCTDCGKNKCEHSVCCNFCSNNICNDCIVYCCKKEDHKYYSCDMCLNQACEYCLKWKNIYYTKMDVNQVIKICKNCKRDPKSPKKSMYLLIANPPTKYVLENNFSRNIMQVKIIETLLFIANTKNKYISKTCFIHIIIANNILFCK